MNTRVVLRLSSKTRPFRILVFLPLLFAPASSSLAGPLETEAAALRAKCLANAGRLNSLSLVTAVSIEPLTGKGVTAGVARQGRDRSLWSRAKGKLKYAKVDGAPLAYVADTKALTLTTAAESGTVWTEAVTADQAEALGTPFPGWLWRPAGLVPAAPAEVRADGGDLVLVSSLKSPRREVWLDRSTGCVRKYTETDATGRVVRTVTCSDWSRQDGVWMPGTVDEVIQGTENGVHRVIRFETRVANPALSDSDFRLP